ncbi:MAG: aminopeptidase P family protein [Ignavibacteriales bacterium]|nr:aminopeptidase P family protein [Ignavibacteriales bacterium]
MTSPFSKRISALRDELHSHNVDAIFISFLPHLRYVSNFSGSYGLGIILKNSNPKPQTPNLFFTDGRYKEQIKSELNGWKVFITRDNLIEFIKEKKILRGIKNIGFDKNTLSFAEHAKLVETFPHTKFIPLENVFEKFTSIKDETELVSLKKAIKITDDVFTEILSAIEIGMTESELAAEISFLQKILGGETDAFEPIVASGWRGALPHARSSQKKIKRGEMLVLDFGTVVDGYHSDMTRTVGVGKISSEIKNVYQVVKDAQQHAIDAVKNGKDAKAIDSVARNYIRKKGYGKYFNHSLGHGVGLQIHEAPKLSPTSKHTLQTGMAITIEPGIYVPELCGIRIEDIVVVEKDGCKVLTQTRKELVVV